MAISITKEECSVIIMETESPSRLSHFYRSRSGLAKLLIGGQEYPPTSGSTNRHIHILSDNCIYMNDWCIELYQDGNYSQPFLYKDKFPGGHDKELFDVKKILISTDTKVSFRRPLENFIIQFIEVYNRGNIITKVLLTYDRVFETDGLGTLVYYLEPIEIKENLNAKKK